MKKFLFILFLLPMAVMAQFSASLGGPIGGGFTTNPVTWSAESREIDASKVEISLKANISAGWHLYSQYQNGTGLPLKLRCIESLTPTSSLLTPNWIETPTYTEVFEPILKTTERYLAGEATFSTTVSRLSTDSFTVA